MYGALIFVKERQKSEKKKSAAVEDGQLEEEGELGDVRKRLERLYEALEMSGLPR